MNKVTTIRNDADKKYMEEILALRAEIKELRALVDSLRTDLTELQTTVAGLP